MTEQETFDFVCRKLIEQGARSVDADGDCAYRGKDGLKCAAGWLLPDDKYSPILEGRCVSELAVQGLYSPEHEDLVCALQDAHDYSRHFSFVSDFKVSAHDVADMFGLSAAVLRETS